MSDNNSRAFEDIKVGDELPELRVPMDRETYFAYNKMKGEINPLHFDEKYAKKLGFPDVVVAGIYTYSFIPRLVEEWIGEAGFVSGVDIRYISPVLIEETIVHRARVINKVEEDGARRADVEVVVEDESGKELTQAVVTVELIEL